MPCRVAGRCYTSCVGHNDRAGGVCRGLIVWRLPGRMQYMAAACLGRTKRQRYPLFHGIHRGQGCFGRLTDGALVRAAGPFSLFLRVRLFPAFPQWRNLSGRRDGLLTLGVPCGGRGWMLFA